MIAGERVRPITFYIVDDDAAVRDSLEVLLMSVGFTSCCFDSAHHFLQTIGPDNTGCLLLDIRMPRHERQVQDKMSELGYSMPIIFIAGHGDVPMAVKAMKRAGPLSFCKSLLKSRTYLTA